jgi:hypothetical protein
VAVGIEDVIADDADPEDGVADDTRRFTLVKLARNRWSAVVMAWLVPKFPKPRWCWNLSSKPQRCQFQGFKFKLI